MGRWTHEEERALLDGVGSFGWAALERKTGHSRREIWDKVRRDLGGGGITRGSYSLAQAMEETGYSRSQLERAADALNQRWQRTARGGDYLITAEQIEDMSNWLSEDFWCMKFRLYNCPGCGAKDRERGLKGAHYARGLCKRCFRRSERFVRRTKILDTLQNLDQELQPGTFLDQLLAKVKLGRMPALDDLKKAVELCSS